MKKILIVALLGFPLALQAQGERKYIREGVRAYDKSEYNDAEIEFRKAEEENSDSYIAKYNTTTALYQQQNMDEAGKRFSELMAEAPNQKEEAKLLHNMGNVLVQEQKYQEAADAYKKSLRLNPSDDDTRYNLAYALEKLREKQQQQQQNQDNKDKQENQQQDQQKQDDKQQGNQDQQQEQKQQQQQQPQELSKEDAERLLNAILQKEKDVKEEVDKKKVTGAKVKTDKDW